MAAVSIRDLNDRFKCNRLAAEFTLRDCLKQQAAKRDACDGCHYGGVVRAAFPDFTPDPPANKSGKRPLKPKLCAGRPMGWKEKSCACGAMFQPTGGRDTKCQKCKAAAKPLPDNASSKVPAAPKHDQLTPRAKGTLEAMARNIEKERTAKRPGGKDPGEKTRGKRPGGKDPGEKTDTPSSKENGKYCITVDFGLFPQLHKRLLAVAADEMRTVENQLVYMLKHTLKNLEASV